MSRLSSLRCGLALAVLASSCVGARARAPVVAGKPGWGQVPLAGQAVTSVRAVPAALSPAQPPQRTGKPGWGR